MFEKEEELKKPVINWLEEKGLEVECEKLIGGRIPDVVAQKDDEILVAIELKLSNWKRAINQAFVFHNFAKKPYVGMPENKKRLIQEKKDMFKKWDIGIIIINKDEAYELLRPNQNGIVKNKIDG